jgi:hypothetical protein
VVPDAKRAAQGTGLNKLGRVTNMTNFEEEIHQEALLGDPEPWESWETKLVVWSLVIGAVGLVLLGALVNAFILD